MFPVRSPDPAKAGEKMRPGTNRPASEKVPPTSQQHQRGLPGGPLPLLIGWRLPPRDLETDSAAAFPVSVVPLPTPRSGEAEGRFPRQPELVVYTQQARDQRGCRARCCKTGIEGSEWTLVCLGLPWKPPSFWDKVSVSPCGLRACHLSAGPRSLCSPVLPLCPPPRGRWETSNVEVKGPR